MDRWMANIKGVLRVIFLFFDYLIWLIFDFSKFKIIDKKSIKSVLVIHLGAYGEILASTPILSSLKKEGFRVVYMVKEGRDQILSNNPNVDKIIIYSEDYKKNLDRLKKESLDAAIILWPGSWKLAYMCMRAGIRYRVGKFKSVTEGLAFFFTRRAFPFSSKHAVVSNAETVKMLNVDYNDPKIEFYIDKSSTKKVESYLKKNNIRNFVIIHTGYGRSRGLEPHPRLWPPERYAAVADYLIKKHGVNVIISGSKHDTEVANKILSLSSHKSKIFSIAGVFNLNELASMMTLSRIVICPNTSVSHLAAALNVPVVDLLTMGNVHEWHPWMDKKRFRQLYHFDGVTYFERAHSFDIGMKCNLAITVDEVEKAADELMALKR